jgi:hypothetical protein
MGLISNIINKKRNNRISVLVKNNLSNLKDCTRFVVIASPIYDSSVYGCEVISESNILLRWIKSKQISPPFFSEDDEGAKKALEIWLSNSDLDVNVFSYITNHMFRFLENDIAKLLSSDQARIYCLQCKSYVSDINKNNEVDNKNQIGTSLYISGRTLSYCPKGHLLFTQEYQTHLRLSSD